MKFVKKNKSLNGNGRTGNHRRSVSDTTPPRVNIHHTVLAKSACPVGHKIVVTNLEPFVTTEDITELFLDMRGLLESKVIRPGVAEVVYKHLSSAVQAVDVYHNRLLDGKPIKCNIVKNKIDF